MLLEVSGAQPSLSPPKLAHFGLPTPIVRWTTIEQTKHAKGLWHPEAFRTDLDPFYLPENQAVFRLPFVELPIDQLQHFEKDLSLQPAIQSLLIDSHNMTLKIFVHPASQDDFKDVQTNSDFFATTTSSYRTLLVWHKDRPQTPFMVKVSLNKEVMTGMNRQLSASEVRRSLVHQRILREAKLESSQFFEETLGAVGPLVPGFLTPSMIVRQFPQGMLTGSKIWISVGSLLAPSLTRENNFDFRSSLLIQALLRSKLSTEDFVRRYFMVNYLKMVDEAAFDLGINFESHAQNLGLEFTEDGTINNGFILRDFGGMTVNPLVMFRRANKFNSPYRHLQFPNYVNTLKLKHSIADYVSSYFTFYRPQVFHPLLQQLMKVDLLFQDKAPRLVQELDSLYLKRLEKHFGKKHLAVPTSAGEVSQLIDALTYGIRIPLNFTARHFSQVIHQLPNQQGLARVGQLQRINQWVYLTDQPLPRDAKVIVTPHMTFATVNGFVVGYAVQSSDCGSSLGF